MDKFEARNVVDTFLIDNGISCPAIDEDAATTFWSYSLDETRSKGWISTFLYDETIVIRATVNFGRIEPTTSEGVAKRLLEANSSLCGLSFATELNSLVTIGFTRSLEQLDAHSLGLILVELHNEAAKSYASLVRTDSCVQELPSVWFAKSA